jgi:hypothetical protein
MSWPVYPKNQQPYFGDGKTYSRELGRVSPEGNTYGQTRWVREFLTEYFWDGFSWAPMVCDYQVDEPRLLPDPATRPYLEVWRAKAINPRSGFADWKYYFVDKDKDQNPVWSLVRWISAVEHPDDLPQPGWKIGDASQVVQLDVLMYWTGYFWDQLGHRMLRDDQPERHLPPGFLAPRQSEAYVAYVSPTSLGIFATKAGTGQVYVQGEYITVSKCSLLVTARKPLYWNGAALTQQDALLPDHEYYIYLANTKSDAFRFVDFDYRGQLFLSLTPDINGYLGDKVPALYARRVGRVETDNEDPPHFRCEVDISEINRTTSFPETYREYSDFVLTYVDKDRLALQKLWGLRGQIYVGGNLYYLGDVSLIVDRTGSIVHWNEDTAEMTLDQGACASNSLYYVYMAADLDPFNFNAINPDTSRPWLPGDDGGETHYQWALDFRRKLFLSTTEPDDSTGTLDGQFPAYYTRFVGRVRTDAYGYLLHARDISQVRQPTLDPTYFDGLAEITVAAWGASQTELRICKKKGTSGIVQVNGQAVQTADLDSAADHAIQTDDHLHVYVETDIPALWQSAETIEDFGIENQGTQTLYVYLCNNDPVWGDLCSKPVVTKTAPVDGYLSRNWPGRAARWVFTVLPSKTGKFPAGCIIEALDSVPLRINDVQLTATETISGALFQSEISKLWTAVNAQSAWTSQQTLGLPLVLERYSDTQALIRAVGQAYTVLFPDLASTRTITGDGDLLTLTGNINTFYYLYLTPTGFFLSTNPPTGTSANLHYSTANNGIVIGYIGFSATNVMGGVQCVCSFFNEPERIWTAATNIEIPYYSVEPLIDIGWANTHKGEASQIYYSGPSLPGLVVSPRHKIEGSKTGTERCGLYQWNGGGGACIPRAWSGYISMGHTQCSYTAAGSTRIASLDLEFPNGAVFSGPAINPEVRLRHIYTPTPALEPGVAYWYSVPQSTGFGDVIIARKPL